MNDFAGLQAPKKTPTGIEGFEHISMGGLTEGRTVLIAGSSGSCKTLFATEYLYRGITRFNHNAVFVTMEEHPREIIRNVKKQGWNLEEFVEQKKLKFIDVSPEPTLMTEAGA